MIWGADNVKIFYTFALPLNTIVMNKHPLLTLVLFLVTLPLSAQQQTSKDEALEQIRQVYAAKPSRSIKTPVDSISKYKSLLDESGLFTDLSRLEKKIINKQYASQVNKQPIISTLTSKAFNRIWTMAEAYRNKPVDPSDKLLQQIFKSINHYGVLETDRLNVSSRWHASCFSIPTSAVNIYYAFYSFMNKIESGHITDPLYIQGNKILGELAKQSWTVPARNDQTDSCVVSVDRFRKHTWWVGGNATAYRPLLETAALLKSHQMAEVVAEVASKSLAAVSQTTLSDDFWTEGITADGAGWGHGTQCLVWGYPIHGTVGSLKILNLMKNYPVDSRLKEEQVNTLLHFIRGSSFYYYKGYVPPMVDRGNMNRLEVPYPNRVGSVETDYRYLIASAGVVKQLLSNFDTQLSDEVKDEFTNFVETAKQFHTHMPKKWEHYYTGSRYFYNNDDIIKKNKDYYLFINMASSRVSGLESSKVLAAKFNIFTCDGTTMLFRKGDEYQRITGALNLRALPGITSRLSPEPLVPIENWNGYNSRHPFAAAATSGGNAFAGGFIFEKNNKAWEKKNLSFNPFSDPNPSAFGVKAYKSYFMFDNIMLSMGCGIENKLDTLAGDIITTIEQTSVKDDFKETNNLLNNGFYYQVIKEHTTGEVILEKNKVKTKWNDLCIENKLPETYEDMFHLYINHGKEIQNASYAYTTSFTKEATLHTPRILSNTTLLQAAESHDQHTVGAVSYQPNQPIHTSFGIWKTSAPCALLIERAGNKIKITVTDALMNPALKKIQITTQTPLFGSTIHKLEDGSYCIEIPLKGGHNTGEPVSWEGTLQTI
jgi:hypothetical protein